MTTNTTIHLKLKTAKRWCDRRASYIALGLASSAVVLAAIIAGIGRHSAPATVAAVPTPPLAFIIATAPAATPAALAASAGANLLPRAVVAYSSPDGAVIGAVEAGRHYGFLARSGDGWLQLAIDGSGDVWVKSQELIGAPDLADVATPTNGPRLVVVSAPAWPQQQPAQQEQIDQAAQPPAPAPAPIPTNVPIVEIGPEHPPAGDLGGPGISASGDW